MIFRFIADCWARVVSRRHVRPSGDEEAAGASVAAGDGRNDIEMLQWAGFSAAMGGADDVTRAAADMVTTSVDDDGVVPVLRALLDR